ncbi:hypothetical protein U1Q18_046706, partial [Sarracenia purpurea var. burkii]
MQIVSANTSWNDIEPSEKHYDLPRNSIEINFQSWESDDSDDDEEVDYGGGVAYGDDDSSIDSMQGLRGLNLPSVSAYSHLLDDDDDDE